MNQKRISRFLIVAGVLAGIGILAAAGVYAPVMAGECRDLYREDIPGIEGLYWVGLIGVWTASLLFLLALMEYLRVSARIGKDRSFCRENVKSLSRIALFLWADGALWILAIFAPGLLFRVDIGPICVVFLLISMANAALGLLSWALGRLLARAVELKEENDLTV